MHQASDAAVEESSAADEVFSPKPEHAIYTGRMETLTFDLSDADTVSTVASTDHHR
jgi:hypothetical protein